MIELRNIHKAFGRQRVLRGLDLTIPKGKITVILGPSGSGKSVTLKHMIGLMRPDKGKILVDGIDVNELDSEALTKFRRRFGMVFQHAALFDSMNVYENIAFPLRESNHHAEEDIRKKVRNALAAVELEGVEEKMPSQLSGGMRKRVGFARAVILRPEILLYDEPTTGLDPLMTDAVDNLILDMQHGLPITSVVISHDITSAFRVADQIAMLSGGRIIEVGPPDLMKRSRNAVVRRFIEGRSRDTAAGAYEETVKL